MRFVARITSTLFVEFENTRGKFCQFKSVTIDRIGCRDRMSP